MKKRFNIQLQFFLTYIVISAIVICTLSIFVYQYTSTILLKRETTSFETLGETLVNQTESALHTMDDVSMNIVYSNLVISRLNGYFTSTAHRDADFSDLVQLFVSLNGVDYKVAQISVYSHSGKALTVGPFTNEYFTNLNSFDWVAAADEKKGHKVIGEPYQTSKLLNNDSILPHYLSLYRQFYDSYGRHLGYIETVQTCKKVFKEMISYLNRNRQNDDIKIYVFNENNTLIYPYDDLDKTLSTAFYNYYLQLAQTEKTSQILLNPYTHNSELIVTQKMAYSGWTYVFAQNESIITAPVKTFTKTLIFLIILTILIVLFFSYWMSKRFTHPIRQMLQAFYLTKIDTLGDVQKEPVHTAFNEFDELNNAFYQMRSDLKTSMDALLETRQQELKSRSLALQSQINPHFYYNSLSSIIVLAENGQSQDVIQFSKNLTSMMRYITNGNMQIVTMLAEINYVEKYMYCMKVRYQSSLNYTICLDPRLNDIEIPKLLIQPIVENAIKYGTNCEPPWELIIESEIKKDHWFIHIKDRGNGFSEEALTLINKRFAHADKNIGMPETKIDGMGMLNVYQRWKLCYPNHFLFQYGNRPLGGSYVSIGRYQTFEE